MNNIFRTLALLQVVFCYIFIKYTKGLMYFDPPTISGYISEIEGSAGDDDVSIYMMRALYFIIFIFFIVKKWSPIVMLIVINIGAFFSLFCIGMMQMASVRFTIVASKNLPMLLIVINQIVMILLAYTWYAKDVVSRKKYLQNS